MVPQPGNILAENVVHSWLLLLLSFEWSDGELYSFSLLAGCLIFCWKYSFRSKSVLKAATGGCLVYIHTHNLERQNLLTQVIPTPSNMYLRDKVTKGKNKHVLKPKLDEDYSSLQRNTSFIVIMCI